MSREARKVLGAADAIHGRKMTIAVIAAILLIGILFMLNQPGGPITETTGVIESFYFLPSDTGAPPQVANVRLNNGALVQASVNGAGLIQPGHVVRLKVYRRMLTRTEKYEVFAVISRK